MSDTWADDHTNLLKILWAQGLSASQIAQRLGTGFTRNAVIGKAHRLGLQRRSASTPRKPASALALPKPQPKPRRVVVQLPPRPARTAPPPPALKRDPEISHGNVTLATAAPCSCKWPVGERTGADMLICGAPAEKDRPYCTNHRAASRDAKQPRNPEKIGWIIAASRR
jgi:GcrA cell cycle regulator